MSVLEDLKLHVMIFNHFIWNWNLQFMTIDQIRNTAFQIGEIFCCLGARPLQIQPRHHPPNSSEEGEWINWDCFFLLASFFSRRVWQPDLRSAVVGQFLSLSTTSRLEILCWSILFFLISCYLLSLIFSFKDVLSTFVGPRGRAEQGKTAQEVEHLRLWRSFQVFLKDFFWWRKFWWTKTRKTREHRAELQKFLRQVFHCTMALSKISQYGGFQNSDCRL